MIATITITAALIALICDAKLTDAHRLQVRRLHRKLAMTRKANEATELDTLYYTSNIGK